MARIFISYAFTGNTEEEILHHLTPLCSPLRQKHELYCSFFEEENFQRKGLTPDEIYAECLQQQKGADLVLGMIWNPRNSSGMKQELRQAQSDNQKILLLTKTGITLPDYAILAQETLSYETIDDLPKVLVQSELLRKL